MSPRHDFRVGPGESLSQQMSLKPGLYKIFSATGPVAARNLTEDRSGGPKGIFCPPDSDEEVVWQVEERNEGRYKLNMRGSPAGNLDGKLFAILNTDLAPAKLEWIVSPLPQHDGLCIVTTASDHGVGWNAPSADAEDKIISVAPLAATKSLPPQYLIQGLWDFKPVA